MPLLCYNTVSHNYAILGLQRKNKKKKTLYFFSVNTKSFTSHILKISTISLLLRTRELIDIFRTFDQIYLVFISKEVNIRYVFLSHNTNENF